MKPLVFYDVARLAARLEREAASCTTVSFDVFDTLLVRRIHEPDLLKDAVSRYISARAEELGLRQPWQQVLRLRNAIEAEHRQRNGQTHPDHEARYPDFMGEVLTRLLGADHATRLLPDVTAYELAVESSMLVARAPWRGVLERLKQSGKRIIALSDMYLPAEHLRRLLKACGLLDVIDTVISSADSFRAKASGAGFQALMEEQDVDPARWIHVGDHPYSDGLRPASLGIRSFVLRDPGEKKRKAVLRRYWMAAAAKPFWKGRLTQQLMQPLEAENTPRSERYQAGYQFLGPLLAAFVHHVALRARTDSIRRVYFLSREGRLFLDIWQRIAPALFPAGGLPETHYLHVSRLALAQALCGRKGLTRDLAHIAFLPRGNRDLGDLARIAGVPRDLLVRHAARHGLGADDPLSAHHSGWRIDHTVRLHELLDDAAFQEEVRASCRASHEALVAYLESEQFFGAGDVALVDIGWLGTIQRFLHDAVEGLPGCPNLHGMLFAATRGIPFPTRPSNTIEGWFYDRDRLELAPSFVTYYLEMFEECCRPPQPGLMAYEPSPAGFRLRHRPVDDPGFLAEQQQATFYRDLQEGILDAATRYSQTAAVTGFVPSDLKPWLAFLAEQRLAYPRSREVNALRFVYHLNDFDARQAQKTKADGFSGGRLWSEPLCRLRWLPGLRSFHAARHTAALLRNL